MGFLKDLIVNGASRFIGKVFMSSGAEINGGLSARDGITHKVYDTNTSDTAGTWTIDIPNVTEYYDGLTFNVRLTTSYNSTYNTLNINGLGHKVIWFIYGSRLTSHYAQWSELRMTYRKVATGSAYSPTSGALNGAGSQTDGFVIENIYDSSNNYDLRDYYSRHYSGANPLYSYKMCVIDKNNKVQPLTLENGTGTNKTPYTGKFYPDNIYIYWSTTTVAANSLLGHGVLYSRIAASSSVSNYTFNEQVPAYQTMYLKVKINNDNTVSLDTTGTAGAKDWYKFVPYNSTSDLKLSDYFASGSYYIRIGNSYSSANYFQIEDINPMYYFDGTNLINVTPLAKKALSADSVSASNVTGTLAVSHGGTGKTSGIDAANYLLNELTTGSSDPTDNDYYIAQYAGGGTTTTTYHRRPVSALWNYIKGKISSVLGLTATSYSGNASTASKIKDSNNNTAISITYNKSAQTSTSWLASWNGYELGTISPSNITVGNASKVNDTAYPSCTSSDVDKVLTVNSSGVPVWTAIVNAEGVRY